MKKPDGKLFQELQQLYGERREAIQQRLREFSRIESSQYFYELAYCLLTPQSSAVNAGKAVERLQERDFYGELLDPEPILFQKDFYIRFHKTKARLLVELKKKFPEVLSALSNGSPRPRRGESSTVLREWLVENVKGLGYKESSHFLRNIGHRNLAILDRHILKNLEKFGAIRTIPKSLTRKQYLKLEKQFHRFAEAVGIPLDELDLLFWSLETGEILK
ncbi:MAG: N-glycosylase/DNA lyase [Bacteroidota bacterium]